VSRRVLVLVEGQTEERFVKDVLGPAFWQKEMFFFPTILVTKRVKSGSNFKGGVTSFAKFENDARRLLKSATGALVTTLLDYYGLPQEFPGMASRPEHGTPAARVRHVEAAIAGHFDEANFLPFLALHEFEAWLFSSTRELPGVMIEPQKQVELQAIRNSVETPEDINERWQFTPSRRIQAIFPAYRKALHGPMAAERIGLERIRAECPHLDDWLKKLEAFAVP